MKPLLLVLTINAAAFAQYAPEIPRLRQFLNLTDPQYQQISDNISQYGAVFTEAYDRTARLYTEIEEETARTQPRPAELGMRYVEIELTCRQTVEEFERLKARNLAVLTTAQKARLQILLDAIQLLPVVGEAQSIVLIDDEPVYFGGFPTTTTTEAGGSCSLSSYTSTSAENRSAKLPLFSRDKLRAPRAPDRTGRKTTK